MAPMTTTTHQPPAGRIHRWTVAELREALASPDLPEDAIVALRIDFGEDAVPTQYFRVDLTSDHKVVWLRND